MANEQKYTEAFKSEALAQLIAEGWPDKEGAISRVAKRIGVPHQTVSRWAGGKAAPDEAEVDAAAATLADKIETELDAVLRTMGIKRANASYKELSIAFGIMVDKLNNLRGRPLKRSEETVNIKVTDARDKLSTLLSTQAERGREREDTIKLN